MKRLVIAALAASVAAYHLFPPAWTGEAERLARILGVTAGAHVAEIGGGSGALAREMAAIVGRTGRVFVTELSAVKRKTIEDAARAADLPQLIVVEAGLRQTNLPSACCTAVYMRNVLHHVEDWKEYGTELLRTVRPGGIVAIIDFAPGAFFHLAKDHGAAPDRVIEAFSAAGLSLIQREDRWGGGMYLLAFRRPVI